MIILIIFIFNIITNAQLLTLGHKQNDKNYELITIENIPNQLNIRFCAFNDIPNLTTNQFNYPNIQDFIPLNKQVLATLITYQRIIQLVNSAALLHYQNTRCKQITLFDYQIDSINHEQIVIMNNIVHILKKEYPEIEHSFKQNQYWEFNMYLYNQKHHYISLEYLKQSNTYIQPFKIYKKLLEQGLHQYLQTTIEFADHINLQNQDIIIQDQLDIYTYLDKDEMDKMEFQVQLMTIIDIEKPQNLSPQHIVFYKMKFNKTLTYTQPYHFRYHLATNDSYATSYVPKNCIIYFNNKSRIIEKEDIFGQIIRHNFNQENYQKMEQWSTIEHLEYKVPTGYLPMKNIVFIMTIGVTLGMAIHVSKQIMKCKI